MKNREKIIRQAFKEIMETGKFPETGEPTCRCNECSFANVACSAPTERKCVGCYSGWKFFEEEE